MTLIGILPGGKAYGMSPRAFDPVQLAIGMRVEMEHTNHPVIAQRIAMDHLVEDRDYYTKLRSVHLDGITRRSGWFWAIGGLAVGALVSAFRRRHRSGRR